MDSGSNHQACCDEIGFPYVCDLAPDSSQASLENSLRQLAIESENYTEKARQHGAVLFRNTGGETAADFDAMVKCFNLPNFPYHKSLSNAVRVEMTERVFSANEAPSDARIYLHHEMAQTPLFPSKLFFFCEQPAASGGATPICRSDRLVAKLEQELPRFVQTCAEKGLRYTHTMPDEDDPLSGMGRSWRSTFRADSREACEVNMAELGYHGVWNSDGSLTSTTPVLTGVKNLEDGRGVFFNQLIAAYSGFASDGESPDAAITFGDGKKLPADMVMQACQLAEELAIDIQWQVGQMAIVDNYVTMHGRRSFSGPRKILASLIA
ncbi:MAG: SyrP protein [Planctomycetaceae bacterium]|nr:SyrP protein [Planctomycetaceae bacterium]|tara:strand:+ start:1665 stop:2633 length:969 start_codon:yes stop_codon:yes gene_type:complete